MEVEEMNKVIAEFVSERIKRPDNWNSDYGYIIPDKGWYREDSLKYHSSWDWLMPVVEKFEDMGAYIRIDYKSSSISWSYEDFWYSNTEIGETKLQSVYNTCYQFITWYNQQKH